METAHLYIVPTVFADLPAFCAMERLPEVTEFFSIEDDQSDEAVYQKFFDDRRDPQKRQFTLLRRGGADRDVIGRVVLADVIEGWKGEIWRIYIGRSALRGRGYGREAMQAVLAHMFGELRLQRVYLDFYTGNPARHLYRSLGFREEGVLRGNCRKNGALYDVHLMSLLRQEYVSRAGT